VIRDAELLAAHRAGDPAALGTLLEEHYPATLGWAIKYASAEDDPEDLAQQAMLVTIEALAKGGGPTHTVGLYLASAVRNLAFTRRARLRRTFPVADFGTRLERAAENLPDDGALVSAMEGISERHRQLLWWREVERVPTKEIAERLGMTSKAASMALTRARRALVAAYQTASAQEGLDGFTTPDALPGRPSRPAPIRVRTGPVSGAFAAVVAFVAGLVRHRTAPQAVAATAPASAPLAGAGAGAGAGSATVPAPTAGTSLGGLGAAIAAKAPLLLCACGVAGLAFTSMVLATGPSNSSEATFPVDASARDQTVTVIRQEAPGDHSRYCEVYWHSESTVRTRRSHFQVRRTPDVHCRVTVDWAGTRLATWDEARDKAVFLTPRPGDYRIAVTVE
jgi:RNA polymerase sigma factor (sigma-70 family)